MTIRNDNAAAPVSKTCTFRIGQGIGYTGKHGNRAWIAEITGTSERYGLERSFRDADEVERDSFTKRKYTRTFTHHLDPGLYEVSEDGERWYIIVWIKNSVAVYRRVDGDRAEAIARLLDDGEDFDSARCATKPTAKSQ